LEGRAGRDKAVNLEIAWHYLRGRDALRAVPLAQGGAEAFLSAGAPHEAEEILKALLPFGGDAKAVRRTRLLLAKALLDQSKADEALPVVELLNGDAELVLPERAEVARMRASAEFSLNREPGESYCELAKCALTLAQETGQPSLITRALFECARAGGEAGLTDLVLTAQTGLQHLGDVTDINSALTANLTMGLCDWILFEPAKALFSLREAARLGAADRASKTLLSLIYSGIGAAQLFLCHLADARKALLHALDLARKVGDDARASTMATNLSLVETGVGDYDEAIRYGQMGVAWATTSSCSNPNLGITHMNLADVYMLTGHEDKALECIETADALMGSRIRWRDRCGLVTERAALALVQGNLHLALDLIGQIETLARGRERVFPLPGPMWKLKLFRAAHLGSADEALASASKIGAILRATCPYYYLDVLAARAWLERRVFGQQTAETNGELEVFSTFGLPGKRALLTAQGFLTQGS
jgi:tetratricopeptide (TPR) repeat protein